MKIIFIGDIVGRSGREALNKNINFIKEKFQPEIIIANAENAASGYGLTKKIAEEFFNIGIDVLTLGNHSWDQRELLSYIEECPKIVRPINYPDNVPGKGYFKIELPNGKTIIVIQAMLRLFMGLFLDDPFKKVKDFLLSEALGKTCNAIFIDLHGEATSEKNAFAHYFDGNVTCILGTHTHVPTSDNRILEKGTAYQTDVGMTGDYNSVIGMDKTNPIHGFTRGFRSEGRFTPATGKGTICGTFIESDDRTGLAKKIEPFQI